MVVLSDGRPFATEFGRRVAWTTSDSLVVLVNSVDRKSVV